MLIFNIFKTHTCWTEEGFITVRCLILCVSEWKVPGIGIGKKKRIEISPSDSLHKFFVLIVDELRTEGLHMTQIKESTLERAVFLIREVSIKPRAQDASCWGAKKHAHPVCYRLGHSSDIIQGGDSCSWRTLLKFIFPLSDYLPCRLQYSIWGFFYVRVHFWLS